MSSPRQITTFSTADPSQPGATIQNPLVSIGVQVNPDAEQFYVLDRARGFIQVIAREAQDYREMGFPILDGYGNRVTDFDDAHRASVQRHVEPDQAAAFYRQYDNIWELIEMEQAMADAAADESVHFNFETGRWYKKKKSKGTPKGTPTKSDKRDPSGSPGAGAAGAAGAASSSPVAAT